MIQVTLDNYREGALVYYNSTANTIWQLTGLRTTFTSHLKCMKMDDPDPFYSMDKEEWGALRSLSYLPESLDNESSLALLNQKDPFRS